MNFIPLLMDFSLWLLESLCESAAEPPMVCLIPHPQTAGTLWPLSHAGVFSFSEQLQVLSCLLTQHMAIIVCLISEYVGQSSNSPL